MFYSTKQPTLSFKISSKSGPDQIWSLPSQKWPLGSIRSLKCFTTSLLHLRQESWTCPTMLPMTCSCFPHHLFPCCPHYTFSCSFCSSHTQVCWKSHGQAAMKEELCKSLTHLPWRLPLDGKREQPLAGFPYAHTLVMVTGNTGHSLNADLNLSGGPQASTYPRSHWPLAKPNPIEFSFLLLARTLLPSLLESKTLEIISVLSQSIVMTYTLYTASFSHLPFWFLAFLLSAKSGYYRCWLILSLAFLVQQSIQLRQSWSLLGQGKNHIQGNEEEKRTKIIR